MVNALRLLEMLLFIGFLKILREKNKMYSNDDVLEEELLKYIELNKKEMDYIAIKKFKNKLTVLKEILRDEEKINKIKALNLKKEEQAEKELNKLEKEKDEELEMLQENLKFLALKNRYWGRSNGFREDIELKEKTFYQIYLFIIEDKLIDLLIEIHANEKDIQEELNLTEIELEKLKISGKSIKAIRSQIIGH